MLSLQVLGTPHPHLEIINKMMANIRHFYVHPKHVGFVAVLAVDDLEKMPLDQLAYNGKTVHAVDKPMLAPTSNYSNGRKLIFTSILVLALNTVANEERAQGKRKKLTRYVKDAHSLPRTAMENFVAGEGQEKQKVEIAQSDRTGIPIVTIKAWAKNAKGEHEKWSQPSSQVQLVEDLLLVMQNLQQDQHQESKLHELLLHRTDNVSKKAVPWIIVTSDGASDQSVQNLMTIIPLIELLQLLDLDGIEKWNYCPYHSKCNPAEMLNRTIKGRLRGRVITSGEGQAEDMGNVKKKAAEYLKDTKHGGEPIRVLGHPGQVLPARRQDEHNARRDWEISFDYEELHHFSQERTKIGAWRTTEVSEEKMEKWRTSEDIDDNELAVFEEKLQWAIQHMRHKSLYGVVITKCPENAPERCDWCQEHPWRGRDWYGTRTAAANRYCEFRACSERFCDHRLNEEYKTLLDDLDSVTPDDGRTVKLCGRCRQPGHTKRTCPGNRA